MVELNLNLVDPVLHAIELQTAAGAAHPAGLNGVENPFGSKFEEKACFRGVVHNGDSSTSPPPPRTFLAVRRLTPLEPREMRLVFGREHHDRVACELQTQQISRSKLDTPALFLGPPRHQPEPARLFTA